MSKPVDKLASESMARVTSSMQSWTVGPAGRCQALLGMRHGSPGTPGGSEGQAPRGYWVEDITEQDIGLVTISVTAPGLLACAWQGCELFSMSR
jgi:hypothetical protein